MLEPKNFGPCFVSVSHSRINYIDEYCYGPFANGEEAVSWMDKQFAKGFRGNFHVTQLRYPHRDRTHDDWWLSDEHKDEKFFELEYPYDITLRPSFLNH
jgi:hypothetical protein